MGIEMKGIKTILVTGGAGYIGSHTCHLLKKKRYKIVVIDDLSNGHKKSLPKGVTFYNTNMGNPREVEKILKKHDIEAVIHFAAFIEAGESMKYPKKFYKNNVENTKKLLKVLLKHDIKKFVFSSTAALFGNPKKIPIKEDDEKKPVNVYGKTKLQVENMLASLDSSHGLKSISLRYFNAAGAGFGIGEDHHPETHLIPLVLRVALGKRKEITVFGTNYATKDGTCVRDYIHVIDLAEAHILALEHLIKINQSDQFNLGSGKGYSVHELLKTARKVTHHPIPSSKGMRRKGDPAILVADSTKIKKKLGWKPKHDLSSILRSAWGWHKKHPQGFLS